MATFYVPAFVYAIYKHRKDYDKNNRILSLLFGFIGIAFIAYDYLNSQNKKTNEKYKKSIKLIALIFKFFICLLSIISAVTLADGFGFIDQLNANIAINCGIISFYLAFLRGAGQLYVNEGNTTNFGLMSGIMFSSVGNAIFDIIQGIAILSNHEYSDSAFQALIIGTIIGASDEIIDFIFEIIQLMFENCEDQKDEYQLIKYIVTCVFYTGFFAEAAIAIYLGILYNILLLQICSLMIESILVLVCIAFLVGIVCL